MGPDVDKHGSGYLPKVNIPTDAISNGLQSILKGHMWPINMHVLIALQVGSARDDQCADIGCFASKWQNSHLEVAEIC